MSSPSFFGANPQPANQGRFSALLSSAPYPLMVLVSIIVLVIVIVFIVVRVKKGTLLNTDLLAQPLMLANPEGGDFYSTPAAKLPRTLNGNQFSFSLWLFLDSISITDDHKIVLYRGNSQSYANGTFFVYMDAKTNSLYASLRSNGALDEGTNGEPKLGDIKNNKYFLQSTVDYIPLQRWVNVTYTIQDTVFSTFVDGDLYSVSSIYELPIKPDGSRPLIAQQQGDVLLGGKTGKQGFNGYIGNSKFYNFALNISEAQVVYKKGPYKASWLSYLGLSNVGLRSPIYKITAENLK
jgi:hypothetical protein